MSEQMTETDYKRRLTGRERLALRTSIGHTSSACDGRFPCVSCEGMYREVERLLNEQAEQDLAMHLAYRPEVVAEIAVHLGSHEDWNELAKWSGGTLGGYQDMTDEWVSTLTLPNGEVGGEWAWLVLNHAGEFHFRTEVEQPSQRSIETIKWQALREAADALSATGGPQDRDCAKWLTASAGGA